MRAYTELLPVSLETLLESDPDFEEPKGPPPKLDHSLPSEADISEQKHRGAIIAPRLQKRHSFLYFKMRKGV